ncbi:MAG: hypothetical protein [Microviridae sp.]|nr:MAG: hypothetical protein [Microviridae sp.]
MDPITLILLSHFIERIFYETPQNVVKVEQTLLLKGCVPDSQKKPLVQSDEGRNPPIASDGLLSPDFRLQVQDANQKRETEAHILD